MTWFSLARNFRALWQTPESRFGSSTGRFSGRRRFRVFWETHAWPGTLSSPGIQRHIRNFHHDMLVPNWKTIVKQKRIRAENVEQCFHSARFRINYSLNATCTIWRLRGKINWTVYHSHFAKTPSGVVAKLLRKLTLFSPCLYERSISAHFEAYM